MPKTTSGALQRALRDALKQRPRRVEQIAIDADLSVITVKNYFSGISGHAVPVGTLKALCDATGLPFEQGVQAALKDADRS